MVNLGEVDAEEQRRVIDEFRRLGPLVPSRHPPGIELDDSLAQKLAALPQNLPGEPGEPPPDASPFRLLREAEAEKLAKVLAAERPQVIALVLSRLPPERAGKVLVRLPPATQADILHRLVELEETDPEILREVERGLEQRLSELVRMQRRRVAGLSAVRGILDSSEQQVGMQLLRNLARHDRPLADRIHPGRFEFSDLLSMDRRALASILAAANLELLSLALVGAPPDWVPRFLGLLPETAGEASVATVGVSRPDPFEQRGRGPPPVGRFGPATGRSRAGLNRRTGGPRRRWPK